MPFFREDERFADAGLGNFAERDPIDPADPDVDTSWGEVVPAAARRENIIGSTITAALARPDPGVQDPLYDPFLNIQGYEEHADAFLEADTELEVQTVKARIDQERADLKTLQSAGFMGVAATFAAGFLDPITFLPIGGAAAKAFKAGNFLAGGLKTATAAVTAATLSETALQATQVDRSLTESAFNIGGAAFLGGVLGTSVGALGRRRVTELGRMLDADDPRMLGGVGIDDLDVTAAAIERELGSIDNLDGLTVREQAMKDFLGKRLVRNLNPMTRIQLKSRSIATLAHFQNMVESPFRLVKNVAGKATGNVDILRPKGAAADVDIPVGAVGRGTIIGAGKQPRGAIEAAEQGLVELRETSHAQLRRQGVIGPGTRFPERIDAERFQSSRLRALRSGEGERVGQGEGATIGRDTGEPRTTVGEGPISQRTTRLTGEEIPLERRTARPTGIPDEPRVAGLFGPGDQVDVVRMRGDGFELFVRGEVDGEMREAWVPRHRVEPDAAAPPMRAPAEGEGFVSEDLGRPIAVETRARPSVESMVERDLAGLGNAIRFQDTKFLEYRLRVAGKALRGPERLQIGRINLGDVRRPKESLRLDTLTDQQIAGGVTRKQFRELAGQAARSNDARDMDRITELFPEVGQVARMYRTQVFNPMLARIMDVGLAKMGLSDETAPSYFTRMWNTNKLIEERSMFLDITEQWVMREHRELTRGQARAAAEEIHHTLTNTPNGRLHYEDVVFDKAGSLKRRAFTIEDHLVQGFLEDDIERVAHHYYRTMSPDVALAEVFGDTQATRVFSDMKADYAHMADQVIAKFSGEDQAKNLRALRRQELSDFRDMEAMRDRLRNTYEAPKDPNGLDIRWLRGARALNLLRQGGGFMISSIPDLARPVMVHGVARTLRDGVVPMMRSFKAAKLAAEESRRLGIGWEMILDTRTASMTDLGDDFGRLTVGEAGLNTLARKMSLVNLLSPWNTAMKQWSSVVTQARILEMTEAISKAGGKKLTGKLAKEAETLAFQRIDRQAAGEIAEQFKRFGEKRDGFFLANTHKWDNKAARDLYGSAVRAEVDRIIVTPGVGDRPLFMSKEAWKTITQYKSFAVSATNRVLVAGLQQRDLAALNGAYMSVGMGMMVYALKTLQTPNRELSDDPVAWITEGVDRSGVLGFGADIFNILDKVNMGPARLHDGPLASRYASRNVTSSLAGPTAGLVESSVRFAGALGTGEFKQSDVKELRRLLPYQNLFWLRGLFDQAEAGFNDSAGVPKR